ncbi:MAG: hypothetical protein JWM44_1848 [Bacilli bacterium]|nr:hypothetical protein [Bacilli bacterium]
MSSILAIISMKKEQIAGGAPIFYADSIGEQQSIAFKLEKILDATAHDLKNGTMIIIKHA